ncbi:MAG: hypothetical protein HC840_07975, partial [Leptolyngbyaceae cyanobacterium RM2_2_4]|nr:hypothetical protein [Leptolyngbyaceae cyanobacterium RM2_2_4]
MTVNTLFPSVNCAFPNFKAYCKIEGAIAPLFSFFSTGFALSLLLTFLATGFTACSMGSNSNVIELTLVSNAVTEAAYREIMPLFAADWEQKHQQR